LEGVLLYIHNKDSIPKEAFEGWSVDEDRKTEHEVFEGA